MSDIVKWYTGLKIIERNWLFTSYTSQRFNTAVYVVVRGDLKKFTFYTHIEWVMTLPINKM